MNTGEIVRFIKMAIAAIIERFWGMVAWVLDLGRDLSGIQAGMLAIALIGLAFGAAKLLQAELVSQLRDDPDAEASLLSRELGIAPPWMVVTLPVILVRRLVRRIRAWVVSLFTDDAEEAKREATPLLVASLGPSFLVAALAIAGLYVLGRLTEPLIAAQVGLSEGYPAWQYILIGGRPELMWHLPLERHPYLAGLVALVLWGTAWWWIAAGVRLFLASDIGRNLIASRDDPSVLSWWRHWFGARRLWRPAGSYRKWAGWLPAVAVPLLGWSWASVAGDPYRLGGSMFAVAVLVWLSWVIHLQLEGLERLGTPDEEPEPAPELVERPGWVAVLNELDERLQVAEPVCFEPPRLVAPLGLDAPASGGVISPVLAELVPGDDRLTAMQRDLLEILSRQSFVEVDPPTKSGELALGRTSARAERDQSGLRHRNQVVLAPEAAGKTTLAMLAACNQVLVHTQASLVVVRDETEAEAFVERLRAVLEPSTLRWTIRVRRAGEDLGDDLAQSIVPDVLVTSLHRLVTQLLDDPHTYAPFLRNLGLVVVDDVESFCGPVEVHAQIAFRRLSLRVRDLIGTEQLGQARAPAMLVLGGDSMHDTPTWAKTLCGIDAVAHRYKPPARAGQPASDGPASDGEADGEASTDSDAAAEPAGPPGAEATATGLDALAEVVPGRYQLFYELDDFRRETGDRLGVDDLIAACESVGVPWYYRVAGDLERRHSRQLLHLSEAARHRVTDPTDAAVVFVAGGVPQIRREIDRLAGAGRRFGPRQTTGDGSADVDTPPRPVPIAVISVVDPDERMALTVLDGRAELGRVVATLPRPVVRPPLGHVIDAHLASDLVDTWTEVADVLDIFGSQAVRTLDRLARNELLMTESRTDLDADGTAHEEKLFVRVPARAVASDEEDAPASALPPPVRDVEQATGRTVSIRDRTNLTRLATTDAHSASHVYYPQRIFEDVHGRFLVIGTAGADPSIEVSGPVGAQDILVEPFLNDDISSPRRRTRVQPLSVAPVPGAGEPGFGAEPVFIGDFPLAVSLCRVQARTDHLATFRLGPVDHEVRQRIVIDERTRDQLGAEALETMAVGLFPNPAMSIVAGQDCPKLRLGEARLIAAAMRALLPAMYRGASSDIEVAIHLEADSPDDDTVLGPGDAIFLYDPHPGGNGAAQAIHRDGVELLLRLVRQYLERVLYYDRLRARWDHWADADEILRRRRQSRARTAERIEATRQRDEALRHRTLTWLDSRLRPEGTAGAGTKRGLYGSRHEVGEGDLIDLGRAWYSADGRVTDLIWTKHRWLLADGGEAMVDVGIDRHTVARRRFYDADSAELAEHLRAIRRQLANPAFELDDQSIWGASRTVDALAAGEESAVGSDPALVELPRVADLQAVWAAICADCFAPLGPLADLLVERHAERLAARRAAADDDPFPSPDHERYALATLAARFVQAIPHASDRDPTSVRSPLHTLLYRVGRQDAKALLMALLLRRCGLDTGLFFEPERGTVVCAVAAPDTAPAYASATDRMRQWGRRVGLDDLFWSELPGRPDVAGTDDRLYVPVVVDGYHAVGALSIDQPTRWVFVPLVAAWLRVGDEHEEDP